MRPSARISSTAATASPSMPQTPSIVRTIAATDTDPDTTTSRSGENGSSIWPATPGRDDKSGDHHDPDDRRRCRAAIVIGPLGEQHQQRRAGSADPDADQAERHHRERDAEQRMRRHPSGRDGRQQPSGCQHRHAADNPWRSSGTEIGAIAPGRPEHLQHIVNGDQRAGQNGRHRQFDHHHAVERRGREHDDRAEAGLDQAEPDDAEPGEHRLVHVIPPSIAASAKALTSMPTHVAADPGSVVPGRALARAFQEMRHQEELREQQRADGDRIERPLPHQQQRHHRACGTAITRQAKRAALPTPSSTGSESIPIRLSPSTDLKSFSVMMPWAPML